MLNLTGWKTSLLAGVLAVTSITAVRGQDTSASVPSEQKRAARLEFMHGAIQKIKVTPTDVRDSRDLKFKPQPLLRYNDPSREIADSAIWRLGTKGRPIALVTTEVYRPDVNKRYYLNQELLAIEIPRLSMKIDKQIWMPPAEKTLTFQSLKSDLKPADEPNLRLNQFKRLAERFTMRELYKGNKSELRLLPTPIDRYEPSDQPLADGVIFAGVLGVNPEILLFLETDGDSWSYAIARMGAAQLWADLDGMEVWSAPGVTLTLSSSYAVAIDTVPVPAATFEN